MSAAVDSKNTRQPLQRLRRTGAPSPPLATMLPPPGVAASSSASLAASTTATIPIPSKSKAVPQAEKQQLDESPISSSATTTTPSSRPNRSRRARSNSNPEPISPAYGVGDEVLIKDSKDGNKYFAIIRHFEHPMAGITTAITYSVEFEDGTILDDVEEANILAVSED